MVQAITTIAAFLLILIAVYMLGREHGAKTILREKSMGKLVVDETGDKINILFVFREDVPVEEILKKDWVIVEVEHK